MSDGVNQIVSCISSGTMKECCFNRLTTYVPIIIIDTSELICSANQLTGFYMMGTLVVKGLKQYQEMFQQLAFSSKKTLISRNIGKGECSFRETLEKLCL